MFTLHPDHNLKHSEMFRVKDVHGSDNLIWTLLSSSSLTKGNTEDKIRLNIHPGC